jgi:hypothetical protein
VLHPGLQLAADHGLAQRRKDHDQHHQLLHQGQDLLTARGILRAVLVVEIDEYLDLREGAIRARPGAQALQQERFVREELADRMPHQDRGALLGGARIRAD